MVNMALGQQRKNEKAKIITVINDDDTYQCFFLPMTRHETSTRIQNGIVIGIKIKSFLRFIHFISDFLAYTLLLYE